MLLRITGAVVLALILGMGGVFAQETGSSATALVTRAFKLPADMFTRPDLENAVGDRKNNQGVKLLPAQPNSSPDDRRFDVREFLRELGAEIPAEGEATFFEGAGALVVRAYGEQMELIEALVGPGTPCYWPYPLIQVNFSLVRFTLNKRLEDSDSLSYANLRLEAGASWNVIGRQLVRTRSGVITRHESGSANGQPAFMNVPATGKTEEAADKVILRNFAENESGTRLVVEPALGPDGRTVEMNLMYRHRSKANANELAYEYDITTSVSVWDGYPLVLQLVEEDQNEREDGPRKYRALTLKVELVNFGGWNQRDQAAQRPGRPQ